MPHPSTYFIEYLLAQQWADEEPPTLHGINVSLKSLALLPMMEEQYNDLLLAFAPPRNFDISNLDHQPTIEFMKQERISLLWNPVHAEDQRVMDLLPQHSLREAIDIMLMGSVSAKTIARVATESMQASPYMASNTFVSERVIHSYRHYFWNPYLAGLDEWEKMLHGHRNRDALLAAYNCGPAQAMFRVGIRQKLKNARGPLEEALDQAYFRLQNLRFQPDTRATIDAQVKLTGIIERILEKLHGSDNGQLAEHLRKFYEKVKLTYDKTKVRSIHELVGPNGSYSGDGKGDCAAKGRTV